MNINKLLLSELKSVGDARRKRNNSDFNDYVFETEKPKLQSKKSAASKISKQASKGPSSEGQVTQEFTQLKSEALIRLMKSTVVKREKPPMGFFVQSSQCVGKALSDHVRFSFAFGIEILGSDWISVPLFSKSVSVVESNISEVKLDIDSEDDGDGKVVRKEKLLVKREEEFEYSEKESEDEIGAHVAVTKAGYCFLASKPGHYVVHIDILSDYLSQGANGVILNIPTAPNMEIEFTVPRMNIQIKIDPSLHQKAKSVEGSTVVEAVIPPSNELSIQWTEKVIVEALETTESVKYTGPAIFDATVNSLFAIGEGMLAGSTNFAFTVKKGALSKIEIDVEPNVKILSVSGMAIKKWHVVKSTAGLSEITSERASESIQDEIRIIEEEDDIMIDEGSDGESEESSEDEVGSEGSDGESEENSEDEAGSEGSEAESSGKSSREESEGEVEKESESESEGERKKKKPKDKEEEEEGEEKMEPESDVESIPEIERQPERGDILRILLDYGMEDSYDFLISSERELDRGKCNVYSFSVRNASRLYGYVACEAKTSVELSQEHMEGLLNIDVADLPPAVRNLRVHTILFAYKSLTPQYRLQLAVTRHEDVGVLVSTITDCHLLINYSANGNVMMKLLGKVQNTQKQYAKFTLPENYRMWSSTVNDALVKPSYNDKGDVLLPLLRYQQDIKVPFNISMSFVVDKNALGSSGTLSVELPVVDVPINYLAVTLYVPPNLRFGTFRGDIKEVRRFNRIPLKQNSDDFKAPGRKKVGQWTSSVRKRSYSGGYSKTNRKMKRRMSFAGAEGVVPVDITLSPTKRYFLFEETVVIDKQITLHGRFRKQKKRVWSKRHRFPLCLG